MNLIDIFKKAQENLKNPQIIFRMEDNRYMRIYIASNPRNPENFLYAKTGQGDKPNYNKEFYLGLIEKGGAMRFDKNVLDKDKECLRGLMLEPILAGAAHGKVFSNCCFCGTEITSDSSLKVGYGPICAEKWGLPWGETPNLLDIDPIAKEELQGELKHDELLNAFMDWLADQQKLLVTNIPLDMRRDIVNQFLNQE